MSNPFANRLATIASIVDNSPELQSGSSIDALINSFDESFNEKYENPYADLFDKRLAKFTEYNEYIPYLGIAPLAVKPDEFSPDEDRLLFESDPEHRVFYAYDVWAMPTGHLFVQRYIPDEEPQDQILARAWGFVADTDFKEKIFNKLESHPEFYHHWANFAQRYNLEKAAKAALWEKVQSVINTWVENNPDAIKSVKIVWE